MKFAQIITSLSTGGAENLVVESSLKFEEKGLEVDVVSLKNIETPFSIRLKSSFRGNFIGLTKGSVYNPLLVFRLIPILSKYDIVHVHLFPTLYWVVLAKWISFSSTKIIYTEHSTNNRRRNKIFWKFIDRIIYKKLDFVGCISKGTEENLRHHLLKNNLLIKTIDNGINLDRFKSECISNKEFTYFDTSDIIIIQISSFRVQKDQKTLIRSLKELPSNYKLLLIGEGNLLDEHKKFVNDLKLNDRVKFLGNREDIPELLSYSQINVLSSHYEGFGLAALEGMAIGKPVIASNVPGLREIVQGAGLLFEQGNANELARHIQNLSTDPNYYNKIAKQCKQRASKFDLNTMVDKYIEEYKKVLNEN